MNKRRLVTITVVISVAAVLTVSPQITQVRADHCHPQGAGTAATPPARVARPAPTKAPQVRRQRTGTHVPNSPANPAGAVASNSQAASGGSEPLSFEQIYSRDFPAAILAIGEAIKAIKAGDRETELAELTNALGRLMTVHEALDGRMKPRFANSLRCPIMGSAINANAVDPSLTCDYKGAKVAFCCAGCPSAWDKLSDAQKQAAVSGAKL